MAKGPGDPPQHLGKITAEIGDHRNDAAQLNGGRHGHAGISPTQQNRHNFEMCRAADGQKFRQPLHNAEHQIAPAGFPKAKGD